MGVNSLAGSRPPGLGVPGGLRYIYSPMKLLIATHSPGKLAEYQALLADLPFELTSLGEEAIEYEVEEGADYEDNARRKAADYARLSGLVTLADDSGLEIEALDGAPGPRSARFLGDQASDRDRWAEVLRRLEDVPWERRRARFVCALAIGQPDGRVQTAWGEVKGVIAREARGEEGFGYDPIFYLPRYRATMAQLGEAIKNRESHRARAVRNARPLLEALLEGPQAPRSER